jgi:hypothetical protein
LLHVHSLQKCDWKQLLDARAGCNLVVVLLLLPLMLLLLSFNLCHCRKRRLVT